MSRTRFVIMPTQGEGRPCPTELTQQKTCPVTPCYSWVLSNWSACKLEVGRVMTLKRNASQYVQSTCLVKPILSWNKFHSTRGRAQCICMQWRTWKNTTKWLNLMQSDIAWKINSHSLGPAYNGPDHGTFNLFWHPQEFSVIFLAFCKYQSVIELGQTLMLWKCTACCRLYFLKRHF